jgi:hypothetical protein
MPSIALFTGDVGLTPESQLVVGTSTFVPSFFPLHLGRLEATSESRILCHFSLLYAKLGVLMVSALWCFRVTFRPLRFGLYMVSLLRTSFVHRFIPNESDYRSWAACTHMIPWRTGNKSESESLWIS